MHYHGFIKTICPTWKWADALHTIEASGGDCTLTEAYSILGDRIVPIGNIQYDCFRSYTLDEMDRAVQEVIEEAKGKRFIPSPTAGPYDGNVDDRVIANYLQFLNGWEYVGPCRSVCCALWLVRKGLLD